MCQWIKYATRENTYTQPQNILLDRYSNGITVKNIGNSICFFNSDPLQPGESKGIGGNYLEILDGRYRVYFQTPAVVPPGYVQVDSALVTEKFYMPRPGQEPQLNC